MSELAWGCDSEMSLPRVSKGVAAAAFLVISASRIRRAVLGIFIVTSLIATLSACPSGTSSVPGSSVLDLINEKRAAAQCSPVGGDDNLRSAADRHAVDIRDHPSLFGAPGSTNPAHDIHTGSDGSSPSERIKDAGFSPASRTGEIIYTASGPPYNTPEKSIEWWMNSPPHKAIIETCAFTHAGVGLLYPQGVQWIAVVDFGAH